MDHFQKVKEYLVDLDYRITSENAEDGVFVVEHEDNGIKNLVIGCADPILIMEQFLFQINTDSMEIYKSLLQKNRDIIHGAFVIDDSGKRVIFRDTLQIANLDINELEGTFNSLALLLTEYSQELISFSKN
ncbi:YbjN domain-containing protein [Xanthovirga aplysinae]|uniref:YbjN domain-containing protein n=1 Tax=Xanthovirga aplysinae TaxID=2529853 RepID=UPI0012BC2F77|nr:YbjN domain-containing protein [Xanthovirga aplysinae]MTI32319.1 molecular chaperone Tir [Xanthovirga aplysinae]